MELIKSARSWFSASEQKDKNKTVVFPGTTDSSTNRGPGEVKRKSDLAECPAYQFIITNNLMEKFNKLSFSQIFFKKLKHMC